MRTAIIALVFAVSYAVNETTPTTGTTSTTGESTSTTGGQLDLSKLKGCNLRCRKLTFIGEGSVPIKPNWAQIELSVEVNSQQLQGGGDNMSTGGSGAGTNMSSDAMKVREEAKHRSAFILNYLKDLQQTDLKDLQMQEISFRPIYKDDDDQGGDKFGGYKATFGLSFKVKIDKFQDVLDHIVSESGANRVDSIVFVADDEVEQQANIKAIELASSHAWAQAQAVQKVLGIQGNLKLLAVRDKIMPVRKLIRRFVRRARQFRDNDDDDDMMEGGDMDDSSMLNWLQGDQFVNALLVFKFDFEDGTINFQEVQPIVNNMTLADTFPDLLKGGETKPGETTKPAETGAIQPTQPLQPTGEVLPNNTAAMKPAETQPVQPVVPPANTVPPP